MPEIVDIWEEGDFIIDVSGDCVIKSISDESYCGINAPMANLTITGTGSLVTQGMNHGIYAKNVTMETSGSITAEGGEYGIYVRDDFTMNQGTLSVRGDTEAGIGSFFATEESGVFTFTGGNANIQGEIYGCQCRKLTVTQHDQTTQVSISGATYGISAYDGVVMQDGTLIALADVANGIFCDSGDFDMRGGTVDVTGNSIGINVQNLRMSGGSVEAQGVNDTAILVQNDIEVTGGSIKAVGKEYGIKTNEGDIILYEELTRVEADGGARAIASINGFVSIEADIVKPTGGKLASSGKYIIDSNGDPATSVTICKVLPDTATLASTSVTYNGKARKPKVTIEGLTEGTDFTVKYENNKNVGTATVTITGIGRYEGVITREFTITAKTVTPKIVVKDVTFTGKTLSPTITVKDGSTTLKSGTDYTVKYAKTARKNVGTYKFTVTLKGNYKGSGTGTFKINPKGTTISSVTAASKGFTVKWKKQATKMAKERITGYEIQLATNSGFTKNKKTVKVKGYSNVSKRISSLKGKTKYYIRIRTYKVIGKTTYYSPWSAVKAVTTKK